MLGFGLCARAESMGCTLRELLTGAPGPITCMEWYVLNRYQTAQARLKQQAK